MARIYIKNLSKIALSDEEIQVLSKNSKCVPTPAPPTTREVMKDFNDLARRMQTKVWASERKVKFKLEPVMERNPKRTDNPSEKISLENYLTAAKIEIANLHSNKRFNKQEMLRRSELNIQNIKRFKKRMKGNFNNNLKTVLRKLKKNKNIIIKKSDEENYTVVVDRQQYITEVNRQLKSCAHYMHIENDITDSISELVHQTLGELLAKGEISKKNFKYLSPLEHKKHKNCRAIPAQSNTPNSTN